MKNAMLTAAVLVALAGAYGWLAFGDRLRRGGAAHDPADWCEEHGKPESRCEECRPALARGGTVAMMTREPKAGECPNTLVRVTLGAGVAETAGIESVRVEPRPIDERIFAVAETQYAPSQYARVAPRLAGVVKEAFAVLGQDVKAGEVLATVTCPELAAAKSAYLQALAVQKLRLETWEKAAELFKQKFATSREELEARTALEEARLEVGRATLHLQALGLSDEQVRAVGESRDLSPLLPVTSPFAGRIVQASAVAGESAGPDRPLFAVALLERLWAAVDVPEADLTRVAVGQKAFFTIESAAGKRFPGRVVAVGSEVDDRTRTGRVYAEFKNTEGMLRARMFGRAEILVKDASPRLVVPKDALQNDGDCSLVFVKVKEDTYQARKVEVGAVFEGGYEIRGGLASGEEVASRGAFLLKSEAMRGQMGAG